MTGRRYHFAIHSLQPEENKTPMTDAAPNDMQHPQPTTSTISSLSHALRAATNLARDSRTSRPGMRSVHGFEAQQID